MLLTQPTQTRSSEMRRVAADGSMMAIRWLSATHSVYVFPPTVLEPQRFRKVTSPPPSSPATAFSPGSAHLLISL